MEKYHRNKKPIPVLKGKRANYLIIRIEVSNTYTYSKGVLFTSFYLVKTDRKHHVVIINYCETIHFLYFLHYTFYNQGKLGIQKCIYTRMCIYL